jgi:phage portal protein BeeE
MMYNEAIQNLSTEIARAMNVPAYYLSADQNTTMTYANVQDERKQFFALSIEPYVQAVRLVFQWMTSLQQGMKSALQSLIHS